MIQTDLDQVFCDVQNYQGRGTVSRDEEEIGLFLFYFKSFATPIRALHRHRTEVGSIPV